MINSPRRLLANVGRVALGSTALYSGVALLKNDGNMPFTLRAVKTGKVNRLEQTDTRALETSIPHDELEASIATMCANIDRCFTPLKPEEFGRFMGRMGIFDETTIASMYTAFQNNDKLQCATHLELAYWCSKLAEGSMKNKLKFAFKACDVDKDGKISPKEMAHFLTVIFVAHGHVKANVNRNTETQAAYSRLGDSLVEDLFAEADVDHNGTISWEEFEKWSSSRTEVAELVTNVLNEWLTHSTAVLY